MTRGLRVFFHVLGVPWLSPAMALLHFPCYHVLHGSMFIRLWAHWELESYMHQCKVLRVCLTRSSEPDSQQVLRQVFVIFVLFLSDDDTCSWLNCTQPLLNQPSVCWKKYTVSEIIGNLSLPKVSSIKELGVQGRVNSTDLGFGHFPGYNFYALRIFCLIWTFDMFQSSEPHCTHGTRKVHPSKVIAMSI